MSSESTLSRNGFLASFLELIMAVILTPVGTLCTAHPNMHIADHIIAAENRCYPYEMFVELCCTDSYTVHITRELWRSLNDP